MRSIFEVAELKLNYTVNLERLFSFLYFFISCNLVTHSDCHCQVQLRRHEKAGIGNKGKRSRNSDRKWTRAFPGKHEQTEGLSSTKLNRTSGFPALEGRRAERGVKDVLVFPRF